LFTRDIKSREEIQKEGSYEGLSSGRIAADGDNVRSGKSREGFPKEVNSNEVFGSRGSKSGEIFPVRTEKSRDSMSSEAPLSSAAERSRFSVDRARESRRSQTTQTYESSPLIQSGKVIHEIISTPPEPELEHEMILHDTNWLNNGAFIDDVYVDHSRTSSYPASARNNSSRQRK
jgi:hypothetical protein